MISNRTSEESFGKVSTLVELLRQRALEQPHRTAYTFLVDGEAREIRMTRQDLDRRARTIAAELLRHGSRGDRALLLYPPGLEFIASFFGCLYAGVIAVPAYPPHRGRSISRLQ
ncbi:MAG: fatty acyl-AMP ligase, partial [Desulfobacterales bacterium]|nr:fatty acyl-AMP ligase [Desulfobacterales bacterium]